MKSFLLCNWLIISSLTSLIYAQPNPVQNVNLVINERPRPPVPANNYVVLLNGEDQGIRLARHHVIGYQRLRDFYNTVILNRQHHATFGNQLVIWLRFIRDVGNIIGPHEIDIAEEVARRIRDGHVDANGNIPIENTLRHGITVIQRLITWLPGNIFIGPLPQNRGDDQHNEFDEVAEQVMPEPHYIDLINLDIALVEFLTGQNNDVYQVISRMMLLPHHIYIAPANLWRNGVGHRVNWCGGPHNVEIREEPPNPRRKRDVQKGKNYLVIDKFSDMYCLNDRSYEYYGFPENKTQVDLSLPENSPVNKFVNYGNTKLEKFNIIPYTKLKNFFNSVFKNSESLETFGRIMTEILLNILRQSKITYRINSTDEVNARGKLIRALDVTLDMYSGAINPNTKSFDPFKRSGILILKSILSSYPGNVILSTPGKYKSDGIDVSQISELLNKEKIYYPFRDIKNNLQSSNGAGSVSLIMSDLAQLKHQVYTTINFQQGSKINWCGDSEIESIKSVSLANNFYSISGLSNEFCLKKSKKSKNTGVVTISDGSNTALTIAKTAGILITAVAAGVITCALLPALCVVAGEGAVEYLPLLTVEGGELAATAGESIAESASTAISYVRPVVTNIVARAGKGILSLTRSVSHWLIRFAL